VVEAVQRAGIAVAGEEAWTGVDPEDRGAVFELVIPAGGTHLQTWFELEGGGTLMGSLFDHGLVDKAWAFIAPKIVGGRDALSPVEGRGVGLISRAMSLRCPQVERVGDDMLVTGYPEARS